MKIFASFFPSFLVLLCYKLGVERWRGREVDGWSGGGVEKWRDREVERWRGEGMEETYCSNVCHGCLSQPQGLKSHAVTMFEVGKLADEALDSFLTELDRVSNTQHATSEVAHTHTHTYTHLHTLTHPHTHTLHR